MDDDPDLAAGHVLLKGVGDAFNGAVNVAHGLIRVKAKLDVDEDRPACPARAHRMKGLVVVEMVGEVLDDAQLDGFFEGFVEQVVEGSPEDSGVGNDHVQGHQHGHERVDIHVPSQIPEQQG